MNFECPYCREDLEGPSDCEDPDKVYEHECEKCGKNFAFTVFYTPEYSINKADCLNGSPHNYREFNRYGCVETTTYKRCKDCGHETPNVQAVGAALAAPTPAQS